MRVILLYPILLRDGGTSSHRAMTWRGKRPKIKSSANYRTDKTMITYGPFSPLCVWSEKSNQTKCRFWWRVAGEGDGGAESKQQLYPDVFLTLPNKCMWRNRIKHVSQAEKIILFSYFSNHTFMLKDLTLSFPSYHLFPKLLVQTLC